MKARRIGGPKLLKVGCLGLLSVWLTGEAGAEQLRGVDNPARAQVNYMLNCQGCHGAEGTGTTDGSVPVMKDFVGNFLSVADGREFLVRVPGSANAALSDADLAELLNWMLPRMSLGQIPDDFEPYLEAEVAALRANPLADVIAERAKLVARMRPQLK